MDGDTGSPIRPTFKGHPAAEGDEAFTNAEQAECTGRVNLIFGDAAAVIRDLEHKFVFVIFQAYNDPIGFGR